MVKGTHSLHAVAQKLRPVNKQTWDSSVYITEIFVFFVFLRHPSYTKCDQSCLTFLPNIFDRSHDTVGLLYLQIEEFGYETTIFHIQAGK